jgi:hypothetical protein
LQTQQSLNQTPRANHIKSTKTKTTSNQDHGIFANKNEEESGQEVGKTHHQKLIPTVRVGHSRSQLSSTALKNHLEKNGKDPDISQHKRDQLKAEIEAITQNISKEPTTVAKMLPRLRDTSKTTNTPGVIKTSKGAWLQSEETRELGEEHPQT